MDDFTAKKYDGFAEDLRDAKEVADHLRWKLQYLENELAMLRKMDKPLPAPQEPP